MKKRTQTLTVAVAGGQVAGSPVIAGKLSSDSAYDRISGVRVYETDSLTASQGYRLGLLFGSSGSVIKDLAYKNEWIGSTAVHREAGTIPLDLQAKGSEYSLQLEALTTTSEVINLDIVFDLENDN